MRVLHVSGARAFGGNEQQLLDINKYLEDLGVAIIAFCNPEGPLVSALRGRGITVRLSVTQKFTSRLDRKALVILIEELQPQLIHVHDSTGLNLLFKTKILSGVKVPTVFSKKGLGSSMTILSRFKYNFKGIDRIICVSQFVKDAMIKQVLFKRNHDKCVVIHDGVDQDRVQQSTTEHLLSLNPDRINFLHVANHNSAKDLPILIGAIIILIRDGYGEEFIIHQIGTANRKVTPIIENLIADQKLGNHIVLYGSLPNAITLMHGPDFFLVSSRKEGGPSALIEAMACGLPPVATRVGIVPEVVVDQQNGFIATPESADSLAHAMVRAIKSTRAERLKMSKLCRETYQTRLTSKIAAQKTYELYKDVLQEIN
ncbi:MAG: glycosyltransferase family 4 protein [Nonlabens sp.]